MIHSYNSIVYSYLKKDKTIQYKLKWSNLQDIILLLFSHKTVSNSLWAMNCNLPGSSVHELSQKGKNTGVGHHFPLQRIFPDQGSTCVSCTTCGFFITEPPKKIFSSAQFSSVTQSCLTLCDSMNHSTPGLPVHHQLPEFTQTHVHRVSDAIQPSHLCRPLLLLPSIRPSIRVFSNESSLRMRWPKYWSFSFSISPSKEHSGLISFRMD